MCSTLLLHSVWLGWWHGYSFHSLKALLILSVRNSTISIKLHVHSIIPIRSHFILIDFFLFLSAIALIVNSGNFCLFANYDFFVQYFGHSRKTVNTHWINDWMTGWKEWAAFLCDRGIFLSSIIYPSWSSHCGLVVTNPTSIHEDEGSTSGLA